MRLRWFVTMATIVAATAALTVLVSNGLDRSSGADDQVVASSDTTGGAGTTTTETTAAPISPEAATKVSGTVTAMHLEGAVLEPRPVPTPLTVTAERGFGNGGRIVGVTVDGSPAAIEWDAGRPFVLSSGGALVLDPVKVELVADGLRLDLAGAVHGFVPGHYHLDTPVAVGTSGVAGARESVDFDAADGSTFEPRGNAALVLGPEKARHLLGPGSVHLEGTLELTDPAGAHRTVTRLDAAEGAFDLILTPAAAGGWTVEGLLGGAITAS
ncbi:MAG: hypothetical protein ACJ739_03980 [Acidimicrobiales bacterium]